MKKYILIAIIILLIGCTKVNNNKEIEKLKITCGTAGAYIPYPSNRTCCEGLTSYGPGFDTALRIKGKCYQTGYMSGNIAAGFYCLDCGNGICEDNEDVCKCPKDCEGKIEGTRSIEDFCKESYDQFCSEIFIDNSVLCNLCNSS